MKNIIVVCLLAISAAVQTTNTALLKLDRDFARVIAQERLAGWMKYMVQSTVVLELRKALPGTESPTPVPSLCGPPSYNCSRTDTNITPLPSVPPQAGPNTCTAGNLQNCGNLTGAGTVMHDPNYNNVTITRCTDAKTHSPVSGSGFFAGLEGSGDAPEFAYDNTFIHVSDSGGNGWLLNLNPTTGVCGTQLACRVARGNYCDAGFFDSHDGVFSLNPSSPHTFYSFGHHAWDQQIQKWVLSSTGPASDTVAADFAQAMPWSHSPADWNANTNYAFGKYLHPSTNNAGRYYYQQINANCTSSSGSAPVFPQTMPATGGTAAWPTVTESGTNPCQWQLIGPNAISYSDPGGVDVSDNMIYAEYANFGGQGSGILAVSYSTTLNTYYLFNTGTGIQTNWACTGGTGPKCNRGSYAESAQRIMVPANGFYIHNMKMSKGGDYGIVVFQRGVVSRENVNSRYWHPTAAAVTMATLTSGDCQILGHWSARRNSLINHNNMPDGSFWSHPLANPDNCTAVWTGSQPPTDTHISTNYGTAADNSPFIGSSAPGGGNYPPINAPYEGEVFGGATDGSNKHWRFGSTLNTYANPGFDPQNAIGSLSTDGTFYSFVSDWLGTLGGSDGAPHAIAGIFWAPNTNYAAGTMICPKGPPFPRRQNPGHYCFVNSAPCMSGSSEPAWNQTVGGTNSEGKCTWTNDHPYKARTDVFIMKLQ